MTVTGPLTYTSTGGQVTLRDVNEILQVLSGTTVEQTPRWPT